jgi:hypothetical protein
LFVQGRSADFDFYIYRDAYTPIAAECPANQFGTTSSISTTGPSTLDNIHNNDWAMYAGVEFGNTEYAKQPDSVVVTASCASGGGFVEVWLDSLDTGDLIQSISVNSTGSWSTFARFSASILTPISNYHDVYLRFIGTGTDKLFILQSLVFTSVVRPATAVGNRPRSQVPDRFELKQNHPNPFNPTTQIRYSVPVKGYVSLKVYDVLGRQVATLYGGVQIAGEHSATFDGGGFASGVYFYRLSSGELVETKKMLLLR